MPPTELLIPDPAHPGYWRKVSVESDVDDPRLSDLLDAAGPPPQLQSEEDPGAWPEDGAGVLETRDVAFSHEGYSEEEWQARGPLPKRGLRGLAAVFGKVGDRPDFLVPGAFTDHLKEIGEDFSRIKFLWQHFSFEPIGRTTFLEEDDIGLLFEGLFSTSSRGEDAFQDTKMGAVDAMSIGFNVLESHIKERVSDEGDPLPALRMIERLELREISLVTFPAIARARIQEVNSAAENKCQECVEINGACVPCMEPVGHYPRTQHRATPDQLEIAWSDTQSGPKTDPRLKLLGSRIDIADKG